MFKAGSLKRPSVIHFLTMEYFLTLKGLIKLTLTLLKSSSTRGRNEGQVVNPRPTHSTPISFIFRLVFCHKRQLVDELSLSGYDYDALTGIMKLLSCRDVIDVLLISFIVLMRPRVAHLPDITVEHASSFVCRHCYTC